MKKKDWTILEKYGVTKDNLTVGGYLYLRGTGITSLPDNLTVGGGLYLRGTGITSLPDNLTVGGGLYLRGTGITSLPDNLTVGGSLYLEGTGITSLPDNLTVGGSLDLEGTGITSLPDNLTVGGYLYLRGTGITNPDYYSKLTTNILSWKEGKYILVDGIFTEVLSKKGNIYTVKKPNKDKVFYLVTDGKNTFSHGDTIKIAKEDLRFKLMAEKLKNEPILADTIVTIKHYRLLTGACEFGVKSWMEQNNIKEGLTAKELLPILEKTNAYGLSKFKQLVKF